MRPQGLIPTSAALIRKGGPGKPGAQPLLSRLFGMLQGGAALAQSVVAQLAEFMAVPAQAAVDAALKMAQALGHSGIPTLTPEQRSALGLQVDESARTLAPEVAQALHQAPEVEGATGVRGQVLEQQMQQEEELISVGQVVTQAQAAVGDARLLLQGWQFEAQRRLGQQIFLAFAGAGSVAERLQLVGDAGPALDALQAQLEEQRATVAANSGAVAALAAEVEQANNDLLMVQTMRDVRDGKPVDDGLLRRMAVYYAERVVAARPAPAGTGTVGLPKGGQPGAGKKGGGKKAPSSAR